MHAPIKNFWLATYPDGVVTQWFAENPTLYARWGLAGHNGIDCVAPHGEPLLAVEDAIAVSIKHNPDGFGKHVRIRSWYPDDDGNYRVWTYAHCADIHVSEGELVRAGAHIADMGNTGFVVSGPTPWWKHNPYAGTHLHLGVRLVVPDENGWAYPGDELRIRVLNYDNGYKGAIDPAPYFYQLNDTRRQHMLTIVSLLRTLKSLLIRKKRNGV